MAYAACVAMHPFISKRPHVVPQVPESLPLTRLDVADKPFKSFKLSKPSVVVPRLSLAAVKAEQQSVMTPYGRASARSSSVTGVVADSVAGGPRSLRTDRSRSRIRPQALSRREDDGATTSRSGKPGKQEGRGRGGAVRKALGLLLALGASSGVVLGAYGVAAEKRKQPSSAPASKGRLR